MTPALLISTCSGLPLARKASAAALICFWSARSSSMQLTSAFAPSGLQRRNRLLAVLLRAAGEDHRRAGRGEHAARLLPEATVAARDEDGLAADGAGERRRDLIRSRVVAEGVHGGVCSWTKQPIKQRS
jgi:hypothetical protein